MTEPQAEAATDPGPEVKPEIISDLDVTGEDADDVVGGRCTIVSPDAIVPGVTIVLG